jgi:glycosyltransferase involved in cell wall biosynthesis
MVKISIITVVFNAHDTIEDTIKSVLCQKHQDVEYLIIDGGSTDGTVEILSRYISDIDFYLSEPDYGLYDAMNKGIKNASGDIIGILNADDVFWDENVLSNVSFFFEEKLEIDGIIGNVVQCNKLGHVKRFYSSKNWHPDKLKLGFMPPHPSLFLRKSVFLNFGNYKLNYKIGADFEFIVRIFLKHRIRWIYTNLTTTKMLIGGLSSSGIISYNVITKEICKSLSENNVRYNRLLIRFRLFWKIKELYFKDTETFETN